MHTYACTLPNALLTLRLAPRKHAVKLLQLQCDITMRSAHPYMPELHRIHKCYLSLIHAQVNIFVILNAASKYVKIICIPDVIKVVIIRVYTVTPSLRVRL